MYSNFDSINTNKVITSIYTFFEKTVYDVIFTRKCILYESEYESEYESFKYD